MTEGPGSVAARYARVKEFFEKRIPFHLVLGLQVHELREGFALFSIPYRPELIGDPDRPALHGGVISAVADACGGGAVWTAIGPTDRVSTIDLRVDYLRPGRPEELRCAGEVLRLGNRVGVAKITVFHPKDAARPIAEAKGVYSVKRGPEPSAARP